MSFWPFSKLLLWLIPLLEYVKKVFSPWSEAYMLELKTYVCNVLQKDVKSSAFQTFRSHCRVDPKSRLEDWVYRVLLAGF